MERVRDTTGERQGQICGCHGRAGKQHSESETPPHHEDRVGNAALDILDVRFARWEIDRAEYEEKKQLISQRPAPVKSDVPSRVRPPAEAGSKPRSTEHPHR